MDKRGPSIFLALTLVGLILGALGVISVPLGHGISGFWAAGVVQVAGGICFGGWGVLAAAFFPSVSNALTHSAFISILGFIPANLVQSLIPAWAFRHFKVDPGLPGRKGILFYLVWGVLASALGGSMLGAFSIVLLGGAPWAAYPTLVAKWAISNMVVSVLVGIPVQRELTPLLRDLGLLVKGWWVLERQEDQPGSWRLRDLPIQVKLAIAMCAGGLLPLLILSMLEFAKSGGNTVPGNLTPLFLIISLVAVFIGIGFLSRETVRPLRDLEVQAERLLSHRGGLLNVDRGDEIGKLGKAFNALFEVASRERAMAERYLQVAEVILVAIDAQSRITMLNRKGHSLLGYEEGELIGRDWYQVCLPPEDYETVHAVAQRIMAGDIEPVEYFENYVLRKDGTRRLIAWHNSMLHDDEGRIIGTLSSGEDITERRIAEQAQQKSASQLRTLIDTMPDLVWLKNTEGVYLECNRRFERFFGAKEPDIVGKTDYDFVAPELADFFRKHDQAAMIAEKPTINEEEITFADDGHHEFLETIKMPIRSVNGEVLGVLGIGRDITERKKSEKSLKDSEAKLRKAQGVAHLGTWTWNIKENRLEWSDEMYKIFGIERDTFDGDLTTVITRAIHPEDRPLVEESNRRVALEKHPIPMGYRILWPDQSVRHVWAEAGELTLDAEGQPLLLTGIVQDITDRKSAEEERSKLQAQLLQAQKLESLGSLASGVAHDMNNVLGAILGLASAQREAHPLESRPRRAFETIIKAADRGGKLVKSLLSFARQSPVEDRELDLNEVIREEVSLLERTTLSKVRLELDLAPDLMPIRGDGAALTHAFMNLCVNAVDAMPQGGKLTLRTHNLDSDWIEVSVEDTGSGMTQEIMDKALDPFFTTKGVGKGTGLGLSIVYSTIKAHKGQLALQSEPGRGTCISIRFPRCNPASASPDFGDIETKVPSKDRLDVLIVDDDELVQISTEAILEALGHGVTLATSGEEALTKLEAGLRAHLVILDMNMPGLGGAGTLPRIRELRPTVPILVATGRADQAAMDLIKDYAFVTLLPKPFSVEDLQQLLDEVMQANQQPQP